MKADVKFSWVPSVSEDVISVVFQLFSGEDLVVEESLATSQDSYEVVGLEEKSSFRVVVTVSDGTNEAATEIDVVIPDLTVPFPVTDLAYEITNTYAS